MSIGRETTVPGRPVRRASPASPEAGRERLESDCVIERLESLVEDLQSRVIGQAEAVGALSCAFARLLSGLRDPSRPLLTALLLGPTGVGKTETAKSLAQTLLGSERALTRINSEEFAHGHEISKLLGSPPGYAGSQIEPLLSQGRIDAPHRRLREALEAGQPMDPTAGFAEHIFRLEDDEHVSIVLFDEIEKAHPIVWNALLGILEDGTLTLGDNSRTDFTRSILLMTSNVGSLEMGRYLEERPVVGFRADNGTESAREDRREDRTDATVRELALEAAEAVFPFEFLNRFDEILTYSALEREDLERIFDKFLAAVHERAIVEAGVPLLIKVRDDARARIVDLGTDLRYGARPLRRAVERELVDPLSRFIASRKLQPGDVVEVEVEGDRLVFYRRKRTTMRGVVAS